MKLGFIGTGEIAKAVITGILNSELRINEINISKRNLKNSSYLKKKSKKIKVFSLNQDIVNNSEWIFLSVTPKVGNKIIKVLKFRKKQIIISFISTIKLKELKKIINSNSIIIRAIPLPPIALKKGPIPIFPKNKKVRNFFNKIGNPIEIDNEKESKNFWAISSLMASYYELLLNTSKWLQKKGMRKINAQIYITSLFSALSDAAALHSKKDLKLLVKKSQTPKGLNEETLKFLKKYEFFKRFNLSLEKILKRLK